MRHLPILLLFTLLNLRSLDLSAQDKNWDNTEPKGNISLGVRSTLNTFSQDGTGLGVGGQFRIRLGGRINTEWFADYISIGEGENIHSEYAHIGWSVMYYFQKEDLKTLQPYLLVGHCFDYNKKSSITQPNISEDRWGSAIQAGLGIHFNLSPRFDFSLSSQYMIHLTEEIDLHLNEETHEHAENTLEGHLLNTLSINYKVFKL